MFQVSGVMGHVLRVIYHLSHVTKTNSHSHGSSRCKLPHYPQQAGVERLFYSKGEE